MQQTETYPSRQVRRQIERKRHKRATRPGPRPQVRSPQMTPPPAINKHIIREQVIETYVGRGLEVGRYEYSLHATKGWRCRRVG